MSDGEEEAPECEFCQEAEPSVYCEDCLMYLCKINGCDNEVHANDPTHRRTKLQECSDESGSALIEDRDCEFCGESQASWYCQDCAMFLCGEMENDCLMELQCVDKTHALMRVVPERRHSMSSSDSDNGQEEIHESLQVLTLTPPQDSRSLASSTKPSSSSSIATSSSSRATASSSKANSSSSRATSSSSRATSSSSRATSSSTKASSSSSIATSSSSRAASPSPKVTPKAQKTGSITKIKTPSAPSSPKGTSKLQHPTTSPRVKSIKKPLTPSRKRSKRGSRKDAKTPASPRSKPKKLTEPNPPAKNSKKSSKKKSPRGSGSVPGYMQPKKPSEKSVPGYMQPKKPSSKPAKSGKPAKSRNSGQSSRKKKTKSKKKKKKKAIVGAGSKADRAKRRSQLKNTDKKILISPKSKQRSRSVKPALKNDVPKDHRRGSKRNLLDTKTQRRGSSKNKEKKGSKKRNKSKAAQPKGSVSGSGGGGFDVGFQFKDAQKGCPGIEIKSVVKGSPADAAGLKSGDIIQMFDRKIVRNKSEFVSVLSKLKSGTKKVKYVRDGSHNATKLKY